MMIKKDTTVTIKQIGSLGELICFEVNYILLNETKLCLKMTLTQTCRMKKSVRLNCIS